jgi:hypothetical protein
VIDEAATGTLRARRRATRKPLLDVTWVPAEAAE